MPVKIKKTRKRLIALTIAERVKEPFKKNVKKFIKEEVVKSIERGVSPVEKGGKDPKSSSGQLRYKGYSDIYKKQMRTRYKNKKQRPVNLKLTGKLLRSIKAKYTKEGVRVWFTDKKAKYHDKLGAGKSKVIRRMIPHDGEKFNAGISRKIVNALKEAIKSSKKRR